MGQSAIIFGGIGTLVETSDLQRRAFNDAFAALGIDYFWDTATYIKSLSETGGTNRLSTLILADGNHLSEQQIKLVHAEKTRRFVELLAASHLPLRRGVGELINSARRQKIKLAWATTTSQANIDGLIASTNGVLARDMFDFIGSDKAVLHQKPDPQIYAICLDALGLKAQQALAIEDSLTGVQSAKAAGIRTIAFPGDFNAQKDFDFADAIVSDLAVVIEERVN
jgi:HAD superfamily hydrolase (TIGR01509 family)